MKTKKQASPVTRRHMLQLLAAMGISGPIAVEAVAQSRKQISPEVLKTATALISQDFDEERLKVITTALQRNLDQFQIVRDLEIDDMVEPATIFLAKPR